MESKAVLAHPPGLEDGFADVLNKALRGLKLSAETLAERADVSLETVQRLRSGRWDSVLDTQSLERLAFVLNLHGPSLVALADNGWQPRPVPSMTGLACFTTWYGDMTVNAYLVWDPTSGQAASFDTGATCQPILDTLKVQPLTLARIFITHTHADHLADLDRLQNETQAEGYGSAIENPLGLKPLSAGDGLVVGSLSIRVLGTHGHTPGGLSYFITGLARPIVIVGDALFAGSMGGAPQAYDAALRNNRDLILSLPPETIICPGHGPLTTVGEERAHNPFFPELKIS